MTQTTTSSRLRPFKPTPFGRYTLLLPISAGGMGEIFMARLEGSRGFEKLCVIKRILPHLAQDKDFVTRFVNEAKTLSQLNHGSIAQILELGSVDGTPFLAIEYVDGKDLRRISARMRDRNLPMPLTFVLYVMGRVLDALAYAHRKRDEDEKEIGLVHRDISPQNILISYEGEVKVIDFGLAKSTLVASNTQPSIVLGKFLYMSPEQAKHQVVDRRSDLYSVGLCLYELIAGKNPFDEIPPGELMHKVASPAIKPLNQAEPLTPPAVAQLVMRALNPDPALRFQTAEEFRGRLLACLMDIDPSAGPESASRFMRDVFSVEHQAEKKLHASLREQLKPVDDPDTAVHLVAPPAGRPVLEPVAPRRDVSPLSFKPTPTNRTHNTDFSDRDRETMPGVATPEGFNKLGEAETAQMVGVVSDPDAPRATRPHTSAPVVPGKLLEPTQPAGAPLALTPLRPRASAPAAHPPAPPPGHGHATTLPVLPKVPGLEPEPPTDSTDPSLLPVPPRKPDPSRTLDAPASAITSPISPLDTLPPSGPHAVVGDLIPPLATNAAAAAISGPTPVFSAAIDAKPTSPLVERVPPALARSGPPAKVDTQRARPARPSMLLVVLPLLAVLGAGAFIGYDLWKEQQQSAGAPKKDPEPPKPAPIPPPATLKVRDEPAPTPAPAPTTETPRATPQVDDDLAGFEPVKPTKASAGKKKEKERRPGERALAELEKAYDAFGNAGGQTSKYKIKVIRARDRWKDSMGPSEEALYVTETEDLTTEIKKATAELGQ